MTTKGKNINCTDIAQFSEIRKGKPAKHDPFRGDCRDRQVELSAAEKREARHKAPAANPRPYASFFVTCRDLSETQVLPMDGAVFAAPEQICLISPTEIWLQKGKYQCDYSLSGQLLVEGNPQLTLVFGNQQITHQGMLTDQASAKIWQINGGQILNLDGEYLFSLSYSGGDSTSVQGTVRIAQL